MSEAPRISGDELAAEIMEFLDRSGTSRTAFGRVVFGSPSGINDLKGRMPKQSTIERVRLFIARNGDAQVRVCKTRSDMSGAALADEIDAFIAANGLSRQRVSEKIFGYGSAIASLRRVRLAGKAKVKAIRAFLADPGPIDDLRPGPRKVPDRDYQPQNQAIRRDSKVEAMRRIEAGLPVGDVRKIPVRVRVAQIQLEEELREEARRACPIEKAKAILRRRYAPVVSAEIVDGPAGKFLVGRKIVSERELLAMARKLAA